MKEKWDSRYQSGGMWYPDEGVLKFSARYLQRRMGIDSWDVKRKVERILDAGCGHGRHIIYFSEQGYDVYGVDVSETAIEIANKWLSSIGLKGKAMVGNLINLSFEPEFFDVVISFGVLDHVMFSEAKKIIEEIKRVLTKGGYAYITLRSTEDSEFGRGKKVDHNTFTLERGYEKDMIQHYFDLEEIKELFQGFKIFVIELHEDKFPKSYSIDKAFLQSSQGIKKYVDLKTPVDLDLKYSRWHIGVEKF